MQPLGLGGTAPLPDCDPTCPKTRSLRPFGPFFANVISGWTVQTNQSTANAASYKSSDLQVAKASGTATKSFTMGHKMGLACIKMGPATAAASKETLMLSANTTTTQYSSSTTNNAFYALDEFETNLPYKVGSRNTAALRCYFIVNPTSSYTFGTSYKISNSDTYRQWNNFTVSSSSNTIARGKYREITTSTPKWKNVGRLYGYVDETIQSFTPILSCKHKLEVWGAQGSLYYPENPGGKGGYTYGIVSLTKKVAIYICVGECDSGIATNAYNVGYTVGPSGLSGGGATHIASTNRGELYNYASTQSEIYVVAGGGGGGEKGVGGAGGGLTGQNGQVATGGAQTMTGSSSRSETTYGYTHGSFGRGGQAWNSYPDYGDGGGGGWYGGGGGCSSTGAGGSGHVGSVDSGETIQGTVSNKIPVATAASGYETGHANSGNARITCTPYD